VCAGSSSSSTGFAFAAASGIPQLGYLSTVPGIFCGRRSPMASASDADQHGRCPGQVGVQGDREPLSRRLGRPGQQTFAREHREPPGRIRLRGGPLLGLRLGEQAELGPDGDWSPVRNAAAGGMSCA
jgi:hypothetical protein